MGAHKDSQAYQRRTERTDGFPGWLKDSRAYGQQDGDGSIEGSHGPLSFGSMQL